MNNKILFTDDIFYDKLLEEDKDGVDIAYTAPEHVLNIRPVLVSNIENTFEKLRTNSNLYINDMVLNRIHSYLLKLANSYEQLFRKRSIEKDVWKNVLDYNDAFEKRMRSINNIYCEPFNLSMYSQKTNLTINDVYKILEVLNIKSDIMIFSHSKYYYQSILENVGDIPAYLDKILKSPVLNIDSFAFKRMDISGLLNFFTQMKELIKLDPGDE